MTEVLRECTFMVWSLSVYTLLIECEVTSQSPALATMLSPLATMSSHHDGMTPVMTPLNRI